MTRSQEQWGRPRRDRQTAPNWQASEHWSGGGQGNHREARTTPAPLTAGSLQARRQGTRGVQGRQPTSRLALARAHFLEEQAPGSPGAAHDAVICIGDPVIPAHRHVPGRAALRGQEHLRSPSARVHAADAASVSRGSLAGVWGQMGRSQGCCLHVRGEEPHMGGHSPQGPSNFLKMFSWRAHARRSSWHSPG